MTLESFKDTFLEYSCVLRSLETALKHVLKPHAATGPNQAQLRRAGYASAPRSMSMPRLQTPHSPNDGLQTNLQQHSEGLESYRQRTARGCFLDHKSQCSERQMREESTVCHTEGSHSIMQRLHKDRLL